MILGEIRNFFLGLSIWGCLLVSLSFIFFLPVFADTSITVRVFEVLVRDFLPDGVDLIVTDPLNAFLGQVVVSLSLAFIASLPAFLYQLIVYLSPALSRREKGAVVQVLIPSTLLFFWGVLFAYVFIVPLTFRLLYPYAQELNALSFFLINEFIYMIFGIMIATGVIFLLPVFMVLLSVLHLVEKKFWLKNWRFSILLSLVFSAIITPDGTGLTMIMLSVPLIGLYMLGGTIALVKV